MTRIAGVTSQRLRNGKERGQVRTLKIYQVDSFTTEKFKGNPAGVVLNADGLTDQEMLYIAGRTLKSFA